MNTYKCSACAAEGGKLWRPYQVAYPELLCVECALKDQNKLGPVDAEGYRIDSEGDKTDMIGWFVPAVPTGRGNFWGYGSIPAKGLQWWRMLPTQASRQVES